MTNRLTVSARTGRFRKWLESRMGHPVMSEPSESSTRVTPPLGDGPLTRARQRKQAAWQEGRHESVEQLVASFPELASDREALLDLIYLEILHRDNKGESPTLAEYRRRFPMLTTRLTVLFPV